MLPSHPKIINMMNFMSISQSKEISHMSKKLLLLPSPAVWFFNAFYDFFSCFFLFTHMITRQRWEVKKPIVTARGKIFSHSLAHSPLDHLCEKKRKIFEWFFLRASEKLAELKIANILDKKWIKINKSIIKRCTKAITTWMFSENSKNLTF